MDDNYYGLQNGLYDYCNLIYTIIDETTQQTKNELPQCSKRYSSICACL